MKRKAFTIWEVLVIVAIAAIGMTLLFPPCMGRAHENARRSSCQSNLKQIGLAFAQYAQDADTKTPPVANARGGWAHLLVPYVKSEKIFQCPSASGDKTGATDYFFNARLENAKNKLAFNSNSKAKATTILSGDGAADGDASYNLSNLPAAWRKDEKSPAWRHLDGANYLFIDGHAKAYRAEKIFGAPDAATPTFEVK